MSHARKDYYELLGIDPTADDAAIKAAFKKMSLAKHPNKVMDEILESECDDPELRQKLRENLLNADWNPEEEKDPAVKQLADIILPKKQSADALFRDLLEARNVLLDKPKREQYDRERTQSAAPTKSATETSLSWAEVVNQVSNLEGFQLKTSSPKSKFVTQEDFVRRMADTEENFQLRMSELKDWGNLAQAHLFTRIQAMHIFSSQNPSHQYAPDETTAKQNYQNFAALIGSLPAATGFNMGLDVAKMAEGGAGMFGNMGLRCLAVAPKKPGDKPDYKPAQAALDVAIKDGPGKSRAILASSLKGTNQNLLTRGQVYAHPKQPSQTASLEAKESKIQTWVEFKSILENAKTDPYKELGVSRTASDKEINAAYNHKKTIEQDPNKLKLLEACHIALIKANKEPEVKNLLNITFPEVKPKGPK